MKSKLLLYSFLLLIASCNNEDESNGVVKRDVFQIAYGTPQKLDPSFMSCLSDNNNYLVAATTNEDTTNPGILVYDMDVKGNVLWSNSIKSNTGSNLLVSHLLKLSEERYLLLAKTQRENQQLLIQINKAGIVVSSKTIKANSDININDCYINSSGNAIVVGSLADKSTVIFELNPNTNLVKWSRQISLESVGGFAVESGKFSFVTLVDPLGDLQLLKLDNGGNVVISKKFYTNSAYFTSKGKIVLIDDHLYLMSSFLQSNLVGLLKIDLNGNMKTATRMQGAEFSDAKVYGNDLLLSINLQNAPTLLSVNANFEVTSHKTIATPSEAGQLAMLGLNDNYISYVIRSNEIDESINFTKLDRESWATKCDLPVISLENDLISVITIYEETTEIESKDIIFSLSAYGVQTEPITLTQAILCQ
jgi:hypothetical protein